MNILDLTKQEDVVELMQSSKTESEWDANCDRVKDANNGKYPQWWYAAIILSKVYVNTRIKYLW